MSRPDRWELVADLEAFREDVKQLIDDLSILTRAPAQPIHESADAMVVSAERLARRVTEFVA